MPQPYTERLIKQWQIVAKIITGMDIELPEELLAWWQNADL